MILAQGDPTVGVLNLVVQGGSFALLAFLVIYGLPQWHTKITATQQKEREDFIKALNEERVEATAALAEKRKEFLDAQKDQRNEFIGAITRLADTFREESTDGRLACDKHFETLAATIAKGHESMMAAFKAMTEQVQSHALRNHQWAEMLKHEVQERERLAAETKAKGSS
jgi:hypothetical protein